MDILVNELSDFLFGSSNLDVHHTTPPNIANNIVNRYASNTRSVLSENMDDDIETFRQYIAWFKNINQMDMANRILRCVFKHFFVYIQKSTPRLLLLLETVSVLDIAYALFYVYGMLWTQLKYRQKIFKQVSGQVSNEKISAEFPGCHPSVVRILLKPTNANHAMRGFQFLSVMFQDIGDWRLLRCVYTWWYNDFVHQRFIPIPAQKIPISAIRLLFKLSVANRFMPYVSGDTLFVPNLVNPVVYSSRNNMEGRWLGLYHFVPTQKKLTQVIRGSEQIRNFMKDTFGWVNNKDIVGRVDFQMVVTYIGLVSSMYLMAADRKIPHFTEDSVVALCHLYRHFQFGGNPKSQWGSLQPLLHWVIRLIRENQTRRKMDLWTLQEQVFFGQNINNNSRKAFYQNLEGPNFETHLDTLVTHFNKVDPTFRTSIYMYVHVINWVLLFVMGNTTMVSGFLEFSKGGRADHFNNYINLHDPKDTRVRYISHWLVILRVKVSQDTYLKHRNKVVSVVFREVLNAIKKRQRKGLLRFLP
jgi:hypothetical protein